MRVKCVARLSAGGGEEPNVENNVDSLLEERGALEEYDRGLQSEMQYRMPQLLDHREALLLGVGQNQIETEEGRGHKFRCRIQSCLNKRQSRRILTLSLIGVLSWLIIFFLVGSSARPGGDLFGLLLMTLAALMAGKVCAFLRMPGLIGMLLVGILFQNLNWVTIEGEPNSTVVAKLRKMALVVILSRAGLGMDPDAFKKLYKAILKLGIIPWAIEWFVVTLLGRYWLGMPWLWSLMLGCLIAAVSPAVIVPTLFRLSARGYGVDKGIPTLIVAAAGIDDATSISVFGILNSLLFSNDPLGFQIAQVPVCVIGGAGLGAFWGYLANFFPHPDDQNVSCLRVLMLSTGGVASVFGSAYVGFQGAGPLAVVTASFVSTVFYQKHGWNIKKNPVVDFFAMLWIGFEPLLFATAGAQVKIFELDPYIVLVGLGVLSIGVLMRVTFTSLVMYNENLNLKELLFVSLSWMAKATVQAALGPVALNSLPIDENTTEEEWRYADIILTLSILSIIVTAPLGAIIISLTGPRLLNKQHETAGCKNKNVESGDECRKSTTIDNAVFNDT